MENLLKSAIWKLLIWLPDFVLRKIFSPKNFSKLMKVDIRPRHDPVSLDFGELPTTSIYLTVTNNSPFQVELDRVHFELWIGGAIINIYKLERVIVDSRSNVDINLKENLTEGEANTAARHDESSKCTAQIFAEFNSRFNRFPYVQNLSGITPKINNKNMRMPQ